MSKSITHRTLFYSVLLLITAALATACGLLGGDNNPAPPADTPQQAPDTAATVAAAVLQTAAAVEDSPPDDAPDYQATISAALPDEPSEPTPTDIPDIEPNRQLDPAAATTTPELTEPTLDADTAPETPMPTTVPTHLAELERGRWLQQHHPQIAKAIHSLPWIIDGIQPDETEMAQELVDLAVNRPQLVASIVEQPWIRDGITAEEHGIITRVTATDTEPHTASKIIAMPWLNDGVTSAEQGTLSFILWAANTNPELAHALLDLGWLYGGVYPREQPALDSLITISRADPATATRIARMPFLDELKPSDLNALRSLSLLALHSPADLRKLMSRPEWPEQPNDKYADIMTVLYAVYTDYPELLDDILDEDKVKVERRTIDTATSGAIRLAVIRTKEGADRSLDLLEHAVRSAEFFTNHPFPNRHMVLLFADVDTSTYHGTHIVMPSRYDANNKSPVTATAPRETSQMVAYYYWDNNEPWIDHGLSRLLASITERARHGAPLNADAPPCPLADSIEELNQIGTKASPSQTNDCRHAIGERFFLSLYQNAGEQEFRKGVRRLLQMPNQTSIGIEQISDAFRGSPTALEISADRWYNGSLHQKFGPSPAGDGILTSIDGVVDDAYLVTGEQDEPVTHIHADGTSEQLHLAVEYSYHIVDGPYALDLNVAIRYEDGFSFDHKPVPITVPEGSHSRLLKIRVGNPPGHQWAAGSYWIEIFDRGRKVAQAELTVTDRPAVP